MVAVAEKPRMLGQQVPRIRYVPDEDLPSRGLEAIELWESVSGNEMDEWQKDVLIDGSRVRPDGRWAGFAVAVNVTRQNGKGVILEARELAGALEWGEELLTHSAHQFDTSMEAFLRMENLLEANEDISRKVKHVSRSHGSEGFTFKNGARIRYRTRTKGGGRGFSGDLVVFDEAMVLSQFAHGALIPTLSARPNPQVWYAGSSVDQDIHEHGLVFAAVRERALQGKDKSTAYFEWSLPYDHPTQVPDEVAVDPAAWAQANPAFGVRVVEDYIESEQEALDQRSFAVERLGVGDWPSLEAVTDEVIPLALWDELCDTTSKLQDPVCIAFDVSPDRRSSIAAAGKRADGNFHVEIIQSRTGTGWLVERLTELQKHHPKQIVCDDYGPAGSVAQAAEDAGLRIERLATHDHVRACGHLVDLIEQKGLRHLGSDELRRALRGAKTRPLSDAWAWSRKNSAVDISPLVAATLALWAAAGKTTKVFAIAW